MSKKHSTRRKNRKTHQQKREACSYNGKAVWSFRKMNTKTDSRDIGLSKKCRKKSAVINRIFKDLMYQEILDSIKKY